MPYTPTTPTLLLCEDLATFFAANWSPVAPDGVTWDYLFRFTDEGPEKLTGRQVVFFPTDYVIGGPASRAEDDYQHQITAAVLEPYEDVGGRPPRDWISERVDFVWQRVVRELDFDNDGPAPFNPMLCTLSADVEVCNVEQLQVGWRFSAAVALVFQEWVPA